MRLESGRKPVDRTRPRRLIGFRRALFRSGAGAGRSIGCVPWLVLVLILRPCQPRLNPSTKESPQVKLFARKDLPVAPGASRRGIAIEINLATDRLAELELQRGDLALAMAMEPSREDEGRMEVFQASVDKLNQEILNLRSMLASAAAKDKAADLARRLAGQQARVASLRQHQAAAERSALKIETHIQNLIYEWQQQQEINGKIANLVAADGRYPDHSLIPFHSLREAVAQELYRVGAGPISSSGTTAFAFPGAAVHDLRHQGDPAALPTFSSKVKARAAWLLDALGASPAALPTQSPTAAALSDRTEPRGPHSPR